ncbi:MAG: glycosyltransferase [Planctomycetes bacterium]|nr:glycosyltransferase [Planctomycetota bacterium]
MDYPLVSVQIITYNHQPYIAQAIEGALQQQTSFPFEILIGEDCSTDGTREIVFDYQRRFPTRIRVITSDRNVGAYANQRRVHAASSGKYLAICDGDDFWHDPRKLQLQVDYLEARPEYSLVHTDADWLVQATGQLIPSWHKTSGHVMAQGDIYEDLLVDNQIMTCTVCVRKEQLDRFPNDPALDGLAIVADYPRWLLLSMVSKIGYLDISTTTRRELVHSISKSPDPARKLAFFLEMYRIREHFMRLRPPSPRIQAQIYHNYHLGRLKQGYLVQDFRMARESYRYLVGAGLLSVTGRLHLLGSKGRTHHAAAKALLALKDMVRREQKALAGWTRRQRAAG